MKFDNYCLKCISFILIASMLLTILVINPPSSYSLAEKTSDHFFDTTDHWAQSHIKKWLDLGMIRGYLDGSFKPDNPISRAEFITLVNRVIGTIEVGNFSYDDIFSNDWFYDDIGKAMLLGYISGYDNNTFKPNQNITRQEVSIILAKLLSFNNSPQSLSINSIFNDFQSIAPWAVESVNFVTASGYMNGYPDSTFKPANYITRAEAITVLSRLTGQVYNVPGTFSDITLKEKNAIVSTGDVTLENLIIEGNLYLAPGIGDGDVTLNNVKVKGTTYIQGGGINSIHINGCSLDEVIILKFDNNIKLSLRNATTIKSAFLLSGGIIDSTGNETGHVDRLITRTKSNVELNGFFMDVLVDMNSSSITTNKCSISNLEVGSESKDSLIKTFPETTIEKMTIDSKVDVIGSGVIKLVYINEHGKDSTFEREPLKKELKYLNLVPPTGSIVIPVLKTIDISEIKGVQSPVINGVPVNHILETSQYSGLVTWTPSDELFKGDTVYTADIHLTAKSGYTLNGVSENFFLVPGAESTVNLLNQGRITARFQRTNPAYKVTLIGTNISTNAFNESIEKETLVIVTVTPNEGKRVSTFTVNGVDKKTELQSHPTNQYAFIITENTSIIITWEEIPTETFSLTYNAGENGMLRKYVPSDQESEESYLLKTKVTQQVISGDSGQAVLVIPDEGYAFNKWSDGKTDPSRMDVNVTNDINVTAEFIQTVSVPIAIKNSMSDMGYITDLSDMKFKPGEIVRIQAVPKENYIFTGWIDERGDKVSDESTYEFEVSMDSSQLFATFAEAEPLSLIFSAGENGRLQKEISNVNGTITYGELESVINEQITYGSDGPGIKAVANPGYMFDGWSDGRKDNPRKEYSIYRDFNTTANFIPVPNIQLAPPGLKPDTVHNYAGSDLDIGIQSGSFGAMMWLNKINEIKIGDTIIDRNHYTVTPISGNIILKTSLISQLQVVGTYEIRVYADGYAPSLVVQDITAGIANRIDIITQPVGPEINEGYLKTEPKVKLFDVYNNPCVNGPSSDTPIRVSIGNTSPAWSLSGTTIATSTNGEAIFSDIMIKYEGTGIISDARLKFSTDYLANLEIISNNFSIGSFEAQFSGAWVYPDLEGNYAGEILNLEYILGNYANKWELNVIVKVNGESIARHTQWNANSSTKTVWVDTSKIPALQKRGTHEITFEATGYKTAKVNQIITANKAVGLNVLNSPLGPTAQYGTDPNEPKTLRTQPDLMIIDMYGNRCFDGPDGEKQFTVWAYAHNPVNWNRGRAEGPYTARSNKGYVTFYDDPIEVINSTRSDVTDARLIFDAPALGTSISDEFEIPRGIFPSPNMILDGHSNNNIIAGDKPIVRVYSPTMEWRYAEREIRLDGKILNYSTDYIYVPEFAAFVFYPSSSNGLQKQGSHKLTISVKGYVDKIFDFHIKAGPAHKMVVEEVIGPHYRSILSTNLLIPFISPVQVSIYDIYNNLCVDGPSSSGVMVTVDKKSGDWNWVIPNDRRTKEAINGKVSFKDLYIDINAGQGKAYGYLRVSSPGLSTVEPDKFEMANWYTNYLNSYFRFYQQGLSVKAGDNLVFRFDSVDNEKILDIIRYLTIDGHVIHSNNYEKWIEDSWIYIKIDTSKVKQLQKVGVHKIRIVPIEYFDSPWFGPNIWWNSFSVFETSVTVLPGEVKSIRVTRQPQDLEISGDPLTVHISVLDTYGNLVPDNLVSIESDDSTKWSVSGVTSINATDGTAIINIRANSNIASDNKYAKVRFSIGNVIGSTTDFYLPGK